MAEMRYSNQKNTAPVLSSMKNKKLPVPHSFFDISRPVSFDAGVGWVIPFDVFETLPDSDYEISYDILAITRNPLLRRLLTGMNIYIHTFAEDYKDMWEGFPAFVSRGRSGKITKTMPKTSTESNGYGSHPYSPSAYMGVPPRFRSRSNITQNSILARVVSNGATELNPEIEFNCLPLVMYQQICTFNYLPSNLLQSNQNFFPENERHFVLSSDIDGSSGDVLSLSYDDTKCLLDTGMGDAVLALSTTLPVLDNLRVRQFQGDRFNTGLPFPELLRGDVPQINLADSATVTMPSGTGLIVGDDKQLYVKTNDNNNYFEASLNHDTNIFELDYTGTTDYTANGGLHIGNRNGSEDAVLTTNRDISLNVSNLSSVTMSQLNALKVLTIMRQRAALSDGSYNELIKAQYNESPNLHVGKPFYVGGTKQPLIFNEVVQTSESTQTSPLGATGSRAVSAGNGYIGKYHSKDFGLVMSVLMIVPDVTMSQGVEKMWSRLNQSDFHFPLMENLSPEPILNKELFVSGSAATDNDVFAYAERCSEFKSRPAVVRGGLVDPNNTDLQAYVVKRHFSAAPNLNYGFTGMFPSNVDYSVFSNTIDTPFILSINSRVKAVLPLSYVTLPNDGLTTV